MNFVVITIDTLRYDFLGANGNQEIITPNLDRFAQQATCFDRVYAGSFPTIPYRTDVFTGRFGEPFHPWAPLSWEAVTLPEVMRNAGYVTMLIHDTPHLVNYGFGYDRPFHGWEMIRGQEVDRYRTDPVHRSDVKFDPAKMRFPETFGAQSVRNYFDFNIEEDHCTPRLFQTATRWLQRNRDHEKFFLWIDSFTPHEPWDPPQHYVDLYDPGYKGDVLTFPEYGSVADWPTDEVKHMRALYSGLVTMVDRWVGYFLKQLEVMGLAENTAVIIDSDHGTYAGSRSLAGKPAPHYDEIAHLIHMVRMPGQTEQRRVQAIVQPPDLMPTILDLAGEQVPAEVELQGRSTVGAIRGAEIAGREFAVTGSAIARLPVQGAHAAVTTKEWSLFDFDDPGRRMLFHLSEDPGQEHNVIADNSAVAAELHDALIQFLGEHEASPALIAFWQGEPGAAEKLNEQFAQDAKDNAYLSGVRRGLGLHPRSFVPAPELVADDR
jgi:arylsulfatase A-like enzyme